MYILKFNKIILELIQQYLDYISFNKGISIEIKNKLNILENLTKKLDNEFYIKEEEQELFIENLEFLNDCVSKRGCNDYEMPKDFTKFELDKINQEFHDFNGDPEEYDSTDDFSIVSDFIILAYIQRKYSIYFNYLKTSKNLKIF